MHSAQRAIPGLPGAAIRSPQLGDCLRRQASASSRPPEPNSRMFMDFPEDKSAGLLAEVAPGDNSPPLTVSELSGGLKRLIETAFDKVRVRGEISGFKHHASGHCYFTLKDEFGEYRRGHLARVGGRAGVQARGRRRSDRHRQAHHLPRPLEYQLVISRMELAGEGALMALLERAPPGAGRGGTVRRRAQAAAAVPAGADRGRHVADRGGDPRYPPPARGPLPDACDRLAGAGAGGGRVGEDRIGHSRIRAISRRARTC